MERDYWQKQNTNKPLFEDIVWSRPVTKKRQGSLVIVGGNVNAIAAPSFAYTEAIKQKIGFVKVLLPDKTAKLLPPKPQEIVFVPSTQMGSLSAQVLENIKQDIDNTDALLLAGDFAKNSETSVLLEKVSDLSGFQTYTNDSLDAFIKTPSKLFERANTLIVSDFARMQKFITNLRQAKSLTTNIDLIQMIDFLHDLTKDNKILLLTRLDSIILTSYRGRVVSTKVYRDDVSWEKLATAATVWWLQNPSKPLEAISTSLLYL
jgi:hypothetical protein